MVLAFGRRISASGDLCDRVLAFGRPYGGSWRLVLGSGRLREAGFGFWEPLGRGFGLWGASGTEFWPLGAI